MFLMAPGMLGGRHGGTNVGNIFGKVEFSISFTNLNLPGVFFQLSSISYLGACKSSARSIGRVKSWNQFKISMVEAENLKTMKFAEN